MYGDRDDDKKMNIKLFDTLMKQRGPSQHAPEWGMFLRICDIYLKERDIKNPVVVEIGTDRNRQKKFWVELFESEHIGIDISTKRSIPEILGDTHDPKTLNTLKERLKGRPINVLFIDGDHSYNGVKKDFEMYSPLCNNIVAFHDTETGRGQRRGGDVWKFWDEMKEESYMESGKYTHFLFLHIRQCRLRKKRSLRMGIGVVIKK
jgi:hypothetical protein